MHGLQTSVSFDEIIRIESSRPPGVSSRITIASYFISPPPESEDLKGISVLLVDDQPDALEGLARLLRTGSARGIEVFGIRRGYAGMIDRSTESAAAR